MSQSKKLQTLNVQKAKNDLNFLDEEDEWAAIYKYNRYLYEKEQDLIKQRLQQQKEKNKADLDK